MSEEKEIKDEKLNNSLFADDNLSDDNQIISNDEVGPEDKKTKRGKADDKIKKLEEEISDLDGRLKRALADYHNLSKNIVREKADIVKYSLEGFFLEILPIFQHLQMAIKSLDVEEQKNPWVEGVRHVIKQFQEVFKNNGLEEIKVVGEKFDYNLMEAIEGDGEIVEKEVSPGYKLKGKVIMPARVVLEGGDDGDM